jgi:hypothetical protein
MAEDTRFFEKFPLTTYRGAIMRDIMRRVDFSNNIRNYTNVFYTHTQREGQSIDEIAFDYYNDVDLDWLIYLSNDMMDPYNDVVLEQDQFDKFIVNKYGSVREAQRLVKCYRSNWRSDSQIIDSAAFESLPGLSKTYWNPLISAVGLISYERKEEDLFATTNSIQTLSFTEPMETPFIINEEIVIDSDTTSTAFVSYSDANTITIRHITGNFNRDSNYTISGKYNTTDTAEVDHLSFLNITDVIPVTQQIYYSKYSFYDYETDRNELKRDLSLVDKRYADRVNQQLTDLLSK